MSRQEQLELQNSSGATTCSHHQETAGCPAESPSKKGSQTFPIWKPRLPATTMSQGREAHEDSLGRSCQDCLSLPRKRGMDRDLTHISQLCPATPEMRVSGCPVPYSHNSPGYHSPYRDPTRAAKGLSVCSPHAGSGLPRRRVHPTFPCAPCSQERSTQTWTDGCLEWRPVHSPWVIFHAGHSLLLPILLQEVCPSAYTEHNASNPSVPLIIHRP